MNIRATVLIALFAALIASGAYIIVPIGPVPITLQSFFILMAGMLGGPRIGLASVTIYLLAGAFGLPVFSGGTGSIAHFFGPTGGYLIGSLPAVFVTGLLSEFGAQWNRQLIRKQAPLLRGLLLRTFMITLGGASGSVIMYIVGIPWLKIVLDIPWSSALRIGLAPFVIGDGMKLIAAISLSGPFIDRVNLLLNMGEQHEPA